MTQVARTRQLVIGGIAAILAVWIINEMHYSSMLNSTVKHCEKFGGAREFNDDVFPIRLDLTNENVARNSANCFGNCALNLKKLEVSDNGNLVGCNGACREGLISSSFQYYLNWGSQKIKETGTQADNSDQLSLNVYYLSDPSTNRCNPESVGGVLGIPKSIAGAWETRNQGTRKICSQPAASFEKDTEVFWLNDPVLTTPLGVPDNLNYSFGYSIRKLNDGELVRSTTDIGVGDSFLEYYLSAPLVYLMPAAGIGSGQHGGCSSKNGGLANITSRIEWSKFKETYGLGFDLRKPRN